VDKGEETILSSKDDEDVMSAELGLPLKIVSIRCDSIAIHRRMDFSVTLSDLLAGICKNGALVLGLSAISPTTDFEPCSSVMKIDSAVGGLLVCVFIIVLLSSFAIEQILDGRLQAQPSTLGLFVICKKKVSQFFWFGRAQRSGSLQELDETAQRNYNTV
jgi:hypothetical protein